VPEGYSLGLLLSLPFCWVETNTCLSEVDHFPLLSSCPACMICMATTVESGTDAVAAGRDSATVPTATLPSRYLEIQEQFQPVRHTQLWRELAGPSDIVTSVSTTFCRPVRSAVPSWQVAVAYMPGVAVVAVVDAQPVGVRPCLEEAAQVGDGIPPALMCPLATARLRLCPARAHSVTWAPALG